MAIQSERIQPLNMEECFVLSHIIKRKIKTDK